MVDFDTARSLLSDGGDTVPDCSDDELTMMEGGKDAVGTSSSQDLRKEESRLQTFRHWPEEWAMELARFGFSSINDYMGTVRCVFCGGEVSGFSSPREAHLKHWQHARHYCPYLRGKDVGDVPHKANTQGAAPAPTGTSTERHHLHHHQTSATFPAEPHLRGSGSQARSTRGLSQNFSSTQREPETLLAPHTTTTKPSSKSPRTTSSSGPKLGQEPEAKPQPVRSRGGVHWTEMVRTARYPSLAVYQERLKTLSWWPLLKPSPAELARAGFFQEPGTPGGHPQCAEDSGDAVKCFWCGQRVHRWQRTDDALLEHARLSPGCLYVIQLLGQPLHDDVVHATTDVARGSQQNDVTRPAKWCDELAVREEQLDRSIAAPEDLLSTERQPGGTSRHHHHHHHHHRHHTPTPRLTPARLDDLMRSPSVQTVLQMGFPRQLIRDLLSHNSERLTAETLCRLALQAAEDQTSSWASSSALPTPRPPPPSKEASVLEVLIPREDDSSSLRFVQPGRIPEYSQGPKSQLTCQTPGCVDDRCRKRKGLVDCFPAEGGGSEGRLLCQVCSEEEVKVVFRPCDHLVCCGKCGEWFVVCPVCQRGIEEVVPLDLAS